MIGPRRFLLAALIVVAAAWTVREIPGFGALPLIDDDTNIFFNPHIGRPRFARFGWMFGDVDYVHRYMPLGWLGFSVVYALSGLNPAGYHIAGAGLHLANAILLFLALERLLGRFEGGAPAGNRSLAAGAAALLWAVHPLRVETTAWCSGLLYSQAGFFALLAVHARLSELEARCSGAVGRARIAFGLAAAAFAASVLTYPVALFLPLALAVVDRLWLGGLRDADDRSLEIEASRREGGSPRWRRPVAGRVRRAAALGFLAFAAIALAAVAANVAARFTLQQPWARPATLAAFGVLPRVLQAAYLAAVYVWWTLWPASRDWAQGTVFAVDPHRWVWWLAVATVLGLSWIAWRLRRRAPFAGACWIGYLLLLAPNLGLMEHPYTAADRYGYLSGLAFAAALGFALVRISGKFRRILAGGICAVAAVGCVRISVGEARGWRNSETWMRRFEARTDDADLRAITVAREAKLRFLGGEVREGRTAAWNDLQRSPGNGGVLLTWREMAPAGPLAADVAARPLQEWPAAPWACAHKQVAEEALAEGGMDEALDHLDAAIEMAPSYSEARLRRGLLLASTGRPAAALHDWMALETMGDRSPALAAGGKLFTAALAAAFRAQGEAGLAERLATAPSIKALQSRSEPPVAPAISAALRR